MLFKREKRKRTQLSRWQKKHHVRREHSNDMDSPTHPFTFFSWHLNKNVCRVHVYMQGWSNDICKWRQVGNVAHSEILGPIPKTSLTFPTPITLLSVGESDTLVPTLLYLPLVISIAASLFPRGALSSSYILHPCLPRVHLQRDIVKHN